MILCIFRIVILYFASFVKRGDEAIALENGAKRSEEDQNLMETAKDTSPSGAMDSALDF